MKQSTLEKSGERRESFEETYPRYPFAEMVRLGISGARWVTRLRKKLRKGQEGGLRSRPLPGPVGAARDGGVR